MTSVDFKTVGSARLLAEHCEEPEDFDCDEDGCYFDDEDPYEMFDCHMDRQGNCGKAGSEECDWECPYRDVKRN